MNQSFVSSLYSSYPKISAVLSLCCSFVATVVLLRDVGDCFYCGQQCGGECGHCSLQCSVASHGPASHHCTFPAAATTSCECSFIKVYLNVIFGVYYLTTEKFALKDTVLYMILTGEL